MSFRMTRSVRILLRSALQVLLALTVLTIGRSQDTSRQSIIARIDGKYTISFAEVQQYLYDSHLVYKYRNEQSENVPKGCGRKNRESVETH